jgi:DNA (cytosine-5)-methyltransferase 1
VFVIGYLGNWRPAAAVLFERHSLSGHPAPSREKRQGAAAYAREGAEVGSLIPAMHSELCPSLKARDAKGPSSDGDGDGDGAILVPMKNIAYEWHNQDSRIKQVNVASTLNCNAGGKEGHLVQPIATHDVAGTMLSRNTSGGFSNSIDHAAAGYMALQPIALAENTIGRKPENGGNGDGFTEEGPMYTLNATGVHGVAQPIAYNIAPGKGALKDDIHVTDADATKTLDAFGSNPAMHQGGAAIVQPITQFGNIAGTLTKRYDSSACADRGQNVLAQPIAYALDSLASNSMKSANPASGCNEVDVSKALDTSRGLDPSCNQGGMAVAQAVVAPTLTAANDPSRSPQSSEVTQQVYSVLQASMAVRRLTPKECERLQGFPDNYTDIKPKGKATPDGPRYKALGNSMAVPVMAWIGKRIQEVDAICQTQKQ